MYQFPVVHFVGFSYKLDKRGKRLVGGEIFLISTLNGSGEFWSNDNIFERWRQRLIFILKSYQMVCIWLHPSLFRV